MVDQTIFQLLRASLFDDKENEPVVLDDWRSTFTELRMQTVAALPAEWLKLHPIPEASVWTSFCMQEQVRWIRVMHGQKQLIDLLEKNGIPCVILKGAAAAMAYPYPTLRSMGDVDFLVKRVDYEKAADLLESSGYRLEHEKNPKVHHYGYFKDGISFELHRRLGIVRESDEELLSMFEDGIDRREFCEMEGYTFPVLPTELNGLVLIFHVNQHLRSGLGLRQIIDWMMYRNGLSDTTWEEKVLPVLRKTGMERLAQTVTAMCQKYLGLRKIVDSVDDYPCDELMDYILEKGNFGRKAGIQGRTASFAMMATDKGRFFQRLQRGGLSRWDAAKKYPVLRPFAWIYQSFRILGILIRNKITPKSFMEQREKGVAQRELMQKLGLCFDRYIERDDA